MFVRYVPKASGEAPARWNARTPWAIWPAEPAIQPVMPSWIAGSEYSVPASSVGRDWYEGVVMSLRGLPLRKAVDILRSNICAGDVDE